MVRIDEEEKRRIMGKKQKDAYTVLARVREIPAVFDGRAGDCLARRRFFFVNKYIFVQNGGKERKTDRHTIMMEKRRSMGRGRMKITFAGSYRDPRAAESVQVHHFVAAIFRSVSIANPGGCLIFKPLFRGKETTTETRRGYLRRRKQQTLMYRNIAENCSRGEHWRERLRARACECEDKIEKKKARENGDDR